jgi:hypothetical protein
MSTGAEVGLIAMAVAREMLLGYFRLLETAGMTPEEKQAHYDAVKKEFMAVDRGAIPKPEDI